MACFRLLHGLCKTHPLTVEPRHIIRDPFGHGFELGVITDAAQLGHVCLGEALIVALEVIREGNVLDGTLLMMLDHRFGHVLERFGPAVPQLKMPECCGFCQNQRFTLQTSST